MNEKKERKKEEEKKKKKYLLDKTGDFLLESLHHIDQSLNFMSLVEIKDAFGADCLLVFLAERVDFLLWMLFAADDRGLHLALQRLLH